MPAVFLFGWVTSENPLIITTETNMPLDEDDLVLMKEFRTGQSYPTHRHTGFSGNARTEATSGGSNYDAFASHSHALSSGYSTNSGEGSEIYYGLKMGEKVVLLRNAGGDQYLVLGRV